MSPYRAQYTESESNITNNHFLYKNTQNAKTLSIFKMLGHFRKQLKQLKNQKLKIVFCILYKLHSSYFIILVNFINIIFLYFCIFIYLYN